MSEKELRDMETKEYDVDTGNYMEDVHGNDSIIGRDADADGLIDNVEKLIADADVRAKAYNEEKARQEKDRDAKDDKERNDKGFGF